MRKIAFILTLFLALTPRLWPGSETDDGTSASHRVCRKYASRYTEMPSGIKTTCTFHERQSIFSCRDSDGTDRYRYFSSPYYFVMEGVQFGRTYATKAVHIQSAGGGTVETFQYDKQMRYAGSDITLYIKNYTFKIKADVTDWDDSGRNTRGSISTILKECGSLPITITYADSEREITANFGFDLKELSQRCRLFTMLTTEKYDTDQIRISDRTQRGDNKPVEKTFQIEEKKEVCADVPEGGTIPDADEGMTPP